MTQYLYGHLAKPNQFANSSKSPSDWNDFVSLKRVLHMASGSSFQSWILPLSTCQLLRSVRKFDHLCLQAFFQVLSALSQTHLSACSFQQSITWHQLQSLDMSRFGHQKLDYPIIFK